MKPDVSPALSAADKVLSSRGHVVVRGPTGSGLHTLLLSLSSRPKLAVLELRRPSDTDASAAALLEASGFLTISDRNKALAAASNIGSSFKVIVDGLNRQETGLVVVVGAGWNRVEQENEDRPRLKRVRVLLQELTRVERLVVLADLQVDLTVLGFPPPVDVVVLDAPLAELDVNVFPEGAYREHALELSRVLSGHRTSPLVWRLGVGLLGLGESTATVASLTSRPTAEVLSELVKKLVGHLQRRENISIESAVKRALIFRTTVPASRLVELSQIPSGHEALVTSCIGYGEPVRVSPIVRRLLGAQLFQRDALMTDAHLEIAKYYRTLDGAQSPALVQNPSQMSAWVERAHHLAESGALGGSEWLALDRPCPELFWDRGRALSLVARDYEGAASVYEECARRFPEDDYAAHYAAFNLARSKKRDDTLVRRYFARAVDLAPENPWWNQRKITSLISQGRFAEARMAWRSALSIVDPDGAVTTSGSTWMFENLFYPVAKAWVDNGCWKDALRVVAGVKAQVAEHREMRELETEIARVATAERSRLQTWMDSNQDHKWRTASATLKKLEAMIDDLPPPAATKGEANVPVLAWSLDDIIVELEFVTEQSISWYAKERSAARGEGSDTTVDDLPQALRSWLERVARA